MNINRENYEIWFTDWMDNNLTGPQVEELNCFLDHNPDLREEFTDLCVLSLSPAEATFPGREKLMRSATEMPEKQFELICAASVENDLDSEREAELQEIVSSNPERRKTLQIYGKLKLKPGEAVFNGKNKLMRKTAAAKIIRLAEAVISSAAIVLIVISTGVFRGEVHNQYINVPVTEIVTPPATEPAASMNTSESPVASVSPVTKTSQSGLKNNRNINPSPETSVVEEKIAASAPVKVKFNPDFDLPEPQIVYTLAASNVVYNPPAVSDYDPDDGRSKLGRFIASRFRSGILNEPEPSDAPLKSYEIAEAGIDGINKLLGWEMALTRNNDENGETRSVQFNSRLLKFSAPVKNNQQAE